MKKLVLAVLASSFVCVAPALASVPQKAPAAMVARHHHHHKGQVTQVALAKTTKTKTVKSVHAMKASHKAAVKAK